MRSRTRIATRGITVDKRRFSGLAPLISGFTMHLGANSVNTLTVERLLDPDALTGLAAEWELLDQAIDPRTPFTSPLWIGTWWQHFQRRNSLFRDEFFLHAVRDADGRLVALAPLMRTFCPGRGPATMRIIQFFGTDPSLTELRGVICRRKDHDKVIFVLTEYLMQRRGEWDVLRWNGLHRPAGEYEPILGVSALMPRPSLPDYVLDLPDTWEALKAYVSSNMRKNLRKAYESLERDGLRFVLRVVERADDVQPAIEQFLALHAARAQAADMVPHPNKFGHRRTRGFLVDYLHRLAARGQLRIFELEVDGKVIASRLAFVFETDLYLYFAGYDPAWKKYSIMTILVAEIMKWAIAHGMRRVNLSTGNDQSKLRWKPEEIMFHAAVQISPTPRGRWALRAFLAYEAASRARGAVLGRASALRRG